MKEENTKKGKVIIISLLILFTISLLIGCGNDEDTQQMQGSVDVVEIDTDEKQNSNSEYKDEIESLEFQIEYLNEQNQYLVSVIKQLTEDFSDEKMLNFSRNQVIYELQINGESIPKNGQVTIPTGNIEILLVQKGLGYEFLPPGWVEKGMISGNYIEHILNFDTSNWTPTGMDGTVNTAQGYLKTDAKAGEHFSFNITDELKSRLKIDTNLIQIEVN
ncbi:hypothetical protein DZB84_00030 [Bacillus sp. HNG]|uniref:hypothetical protein n=1 Tax=Bacillus sp. HNG TaxID=2293325 RepID=UPI000E2EF340|nr:hypothetical protein [Bacillus sp. HNG]RFB18682.1 hypothetical protein DZB84_00030 [Bacillus sp. HNG]